MATGVDEQVIIVHIGADGPVEIARNSRAAPGSPKITDAHFRPPQPVRWSGNRWPVTLLRLRSSRSGTARGSGLAEAAAAGTG
jgi:hypothetical protein